MLELVLASYEDCNTVDQQQLAPRLASAAAAHLQFVTKQQQQVQLQVQQELVACRALAQGQLQQMDQPLVVIQGQQLLLRQAHSAVHAQEQQEQRHQQELADIKASMAAMAAQLQAVQQQQQQQGNRQR